MNLRERIPAHYAEILPICPCGCEGKNVSEWPDFPIPNYVHKIRERKLLPNDSEINIERALIHQKKYIEDPLFHHMRHIRLMFPWVTHDPNLVRLVNESILCDQEGIKMMHMIGHASSGKTHFIVIDAFRNLDIWPNYSECFVASPYRSASEYLLWEEFNSTADMLKSIGRDVYKRAGSISMGHKSKAGPGTITLVSFHAVGVLRGKKLDDAGRGIGRLGVYLDEAGEFKNDAILHIIANLKSQTGFRLRTGTNFTSITGLDGKFNQPADMAWSELNRELSYRWNSVNGARTIRMRAKRSPNIVIGADYYTYLLKDAEHADLLKYGEDSPYYLAQGDAFPSVKSISRVLISEADIQGGQTYEQVKFSQGTEEKFAFSDPSFSEHGDGSIITSGTLGMPSMMGEKKIRVDDVRELKINDYTKWDDHFLGLAKKLRESKGLKETFREGELITPYDLNALLIGEYLLENNIPFSNFGFDDSLRGAITASMIYFLGEGVESVYYGSRPTNKLTFPAEYKYGLEKNTGSNRRTRIRMRSDELYTNIVSQMWFVTASMIKAGYIRDAFIAQTALDQMQLRLKAEIKSAASERKLGVESKNDYKDRNRNQSPDHADSFCGLIWLIVERRLAPSVDSSDASLRGGQATVRHLLARAQAKELKRNSKIQTLSR